jgi:uncharacterized cupredoxin-like copper-binding protein
MRFSTIAVLTASVPAFVFAANHTVLVGQDGKATFTPSTITAVVGDIVNFQFAGGNHTVTQSTFADPCTQPFNTTSGAAGFDSGFMPVDPASPNVMIWALEVKTTAPLWFFCARKGHCQSGMAGAINPPATGNTFDAFKAKLATADAPPYGTTKPITTSSNSSGFKTASLSASAATVAMGLVASVFMGL